MKEVPCNHHVKTPGWKSLEALLEEFAEVATVIESRLYEHNGCEAASKWLEKINEAISIVKSG